MGIRSSTYVNLETPRKSTNRADFRLVELTQASEASRAPSPVFLGAPSLSKFLLREGAWVGTAHSFVAPAIGRPAEGEVIFT